MHAPLLLRRPSLGFLIGLLALCLTASALVPAGAAAAQDGSTRGASRADRPGSGNDARRPRRFASRTPKAKHGAKHSRKKAPAKMKQARLAPPTGDQTTSAGPGATPPIETIAAPDETADPTTLPAIMTEPSPGDEAAAEASENLPPFEETTPPPSEITPPPPTEATPPPSTETAPTGSSGGESLGSAAQPFFAASQISEFWLNQSAPGAVTEVADPAGGPEKVLKMTVSNQDVAPITPTTGPRAQLLSPESIEPGEEFWWSGKFFLPIEGFPASIPQWLNIIEGAYGAPWNGTPPFEIEAVGKTLRWERNSTYNWDVPWEMPLERGKWISYMVHEKLATNGFVELWIDGQQITFFQHSSLNPNHEKQTTKLNMQTLDQSNDGGPNFVVIQNYRQPNMFQSVTLYHGGIKLGRTRAAVE